MCGWGVGGHLFSLKTLLLVYLFIVTAVEKLNIVCVWVGGGRAFVFSENTVTSLPFYLGMLLALWLSGRASAL